MALVLTRGVNRHEPQLRLQLLCLGDVRKQTRDHILYLHRLVFQELLRLSDLGVDFGVESAECLTRRLNLGAGCLLDQQEFTPEGAEVLVLFFELEDALAGPELLAGIDSLGVH